MSDADAPTAERFWEDRYQQRPQLWSGAPNAALLDQATGLAVGSALDLGCGEGADAIWLAEQGWQVTAVDISQTALDRGATHAASIGVAERITWERHDLAVSFPDGVYDLVCAQFLHSPVELPRNRILQSAAAAVDHGGTLLVVGHAELPPWAPARPASFHFPSPQEVVDSLALPPDQWTITTCASVGREATGPDGQHATLVDSVVRLLRR